MPVRRASVVWAFVVAHVVAAGFVGSHAAAAPLDRDDVVAFLVEGTGNGHGRGLSQWGAYGWAVDHGWTWEEILDHYYGGTVSGKIDVDQRIRVRLTDWDGAGWFGFVSTSGQASWSSPDGANGSSPGSVRVVESSDGLFDVAVAAEVACPGTSTLTVPDGPIAEDDQDGDAIRRIQTFLTAFGHDPKGIDGEFGPLTASAVRAFQVAEDLTVN
ncbi:MAG: peptidoglycan-binding protein, partial [Ilumatobacteraceae bacterium]